MRRCHACGETFKNSPYYRSDLWCSGCDRIPVAIRCALARLSENLQPKPGRKSTKMPKIVNRGTPKLKCARHKCNGCNSTVEYTGDDVRSDQRSESYVVCPVCDNWIDTVRLDWRFTEINNSDPDQEPEWRP